MKVQNVSLGFGQSPKTNAGENSPNIFMMTTSGVAAGAIAGQLARKYSPVSDEFFFDTAKKNSDEKISMQNLVSQFIKDYSLSDIQDARILKTALDSQNVKQIVPKLQNQGILELINEPLIKKIGRGDSSELRNSLAVLRATLVKDLALTDENERLNKFENTSDMASDLFTKAKNGIQVKEHLQNYSQNLKGLAENGKDSIQSVKTKIADNADIPKPVKEELLRAFGDMVQITKLSQRSPGLWVAIPSVALGVVSFIHSVNRKMSTSNKKES